MTDMQPGQSIQDAIGPEGEMVARKGGTLGATMEGLAGMRLRSIALLGGGLGLEAGQRIAEVMGGDGIAVAVHGQKGAVMSGLGNAGLVNAATELHTPAGQKQTAQAPAAKAAANRM